MRLLHIADVHLDTPFASRTAEIRSRLRTASRTALSRAFDIAVDSEVDVVLIAGDLFDGGRLSFETEAFLVRELERLGRHDVSVVYATGNHDPGHGGLRAFDRPWPDHVTVVADRTPVRTAIRRDGEIVGWVTAAGHATPRETMDLARTLPRPVRDLPEVALLHTQVHGAVRSEEHHPYAPSELAYLERAGFHYWALGHVHTRQELSASPSIWYAGNLQGRTPAERGPRGALLVDLADPERPDVRFRPCAPIVWTTLVVEGLTEVHGVDGVVRRVSEEWERARSVPVEPLGEVEGWIARVELAGSSPLWRALERREERSTLADEIADAIGALDVDVRIRDLHAPLRLEDHRRRRDVLGEVVRLVEAVLAGGEIGFAPSPGDLAASEDDPELDPGAWARELLAQNPEELIARLLDPEALKAEMERLADGPEEDFGTGAERTPTEPATMRRAAPRRDSEPSRQASLDFRDTD